jgi:hypothetical protein
MSDKLLSAARLALAVVVLSAWAGVASACIALMGAGGPCGRPPAADVHFIGTNSQTADQASYTYTAEPIGGTTRPDRRIVVVTGGTLTVAISSVTVNGGATTKAQLGGMAGTSSAFFITNDPYPNGTTADIVVNFAATASRSHIAVYAVFSLTSITPTDSAQAPSAGEDLIIQPGGIAIAMSLSNGSACAWTGITERYDQLIEAASLNCGGDVVSRAGQTISVGATLTGSTVNGNMAFAWR